MQNELYWATGILKLQALFRNELNQNMWLQITFFKDFIIFLKFTYLFWERKSEACEQGRGREGERESQADSALSALSLRQDWNPQTVKVWPEPKSRFGLLTDWATQGTPRFYYYFFKVHLFVLRESKNKQGRSRERRRQKIWSRLCTDSREPYVGPKLMNHEIMTWAEVRWLTDWAT